MDEYGLRPNNVIMNRSYGVAIGYDEERPLANDPNP
jgi:hypothetical protein